MVRDAEANANADEERKQLIEAKNQADSLIYSADKSLKEYGDKISSQDKSEIESAIDDLKKALDDNNLEMIKSKTEVLTQATMKIGQAMYQQQQENQAGSHEHPSGEQSSDSKENVVDADFKEVKEEDK